jgi:hypothetical protein
MDTDRFACSCLRSSAGCHLCIRPYRRSSPFQPFVTAPRHATAGDHTPQQQKQALAQRKGLLVVKGCLQ